MPKRRPFVASILVPLIVGLAVLNTVMQRPRFAAYRTVDVITLLGCGACFGVALAVFGFWLKARKTDPPGR